MLFPLCLLSWNLDLSRILFFQMGHPGMPHYPPMGMHPMGQRPPNMPPVSHGMMPQMMPPMGGPQMGQVSWFLMVLLIAS